MFVLCKYMFNSNKLIYFFLPLTLLVAHCFDALLVLSYEYQQVLVFLLFLPFYACSRIFLFPYIYSFVRYIVLISSGKFSL